MLTGILDVMIISLGPALLLVLFVVGMVTTFAALARSQRQAREIERQNVRQRELQIGRIRRATEDDVTEFGEELRRLDADLPVDDLSSEATSDWSHALDCYDRAKDLLSQDHSTQVVPLVTEALQEGRHAVMCVRARAAGDPVPQLRPPCFFDPSHGPSVRDVMWTPDGGAARAVPACAADASRIEQGQAPWIRAVALNGNQVPYWQDEDYSMWAKGYFHQFRDSTAGGIAMGALGLGILGAIFNSFDD